MNDFFRTVGDELRRARRDAGLALRDLSKSSAGEFKASAVGGYERGERSISLDRFFRLGALYGIAPDRLLARIAARLSPEAAEDRVIDLRQGDDLPVREGTSPAWKREAPGSMGGN